MYRLKISQLVVVCIDAYTKEQTRIPPINNLCAALELHEVGLVFLVSRCDEAMDLENGQYRPTDVEVI